MRVQDLSYNRFKCFRLRPHVGCLDLLDGQLRFQSVDFIQGIVRGFDGARRAERQDDLKSGRHGPPRKAEQRCVASDLRFGIEGLQLIFRSEARRPAGSDGLPAPT